MGKKLGSADHIIRLAESDGDVECCMRIRKEVFIDEQGYDINIETNDDDSQSTHFLLLLKKDGEKEKPIGTIRLINHNNQLGRFAILKPYRGLGLGKPLIVAVHDYVRGKGGREVWGQSQAGDVSKGEVDAIGFYKKLGYVEKGERYMKEGVQHQDMVLILSPSI